jgi:tetratricopeptide (TPR) repeat protein
VDRYAQIDRGTDWCVGYQVAAGIGWGDARTRRQTMALLDTVPGDPLYCAQRALAMTPALWESYEVVWDEQLTRDTFDPPFRGDARQPRAWALAQRGRLAEASDWLEDVDGREPSLERARIEVRWLIAGFEDDRLRRWADVLDRGPETDPGDRWRLALIAAGEGRWSDAEGQVGALRALADSLLAISDSAALGLRTGGKIARLADATAAAIALRRTPDDPDAVDRAIDALFAVSTGEVYLTMAMRYDIGRSLAEAGRLEDARPYFESFRWSARPYKTPSEYWLGRIYEGLGNAEEARRHYGNFVTWWEDADPQLHEWREEARERLARLLPDG